MKGPIEYIKEAWSIYTKKENFIFFAKIMAVTTVISTSLSLLFGNLYPTQNFYNNPAFFRELQWTPLFIFLAILTILISLWTYTVPLMSIINMDNSTEKEVLVLGIKNMFRLFLLSLVLWIILFLGFMLFIIPGIIFMTWFLFANFFYFDKKLKLFDSLRQSKTLVKGKFWGVLGRGLVFGLFGFLVGFVLGFVPYAGSIIVSFLAPLFILPSYLLYRDLSAGLDNLGTV